MRQVFGWMALAGAAGVFGSACTATAMGEPPAPIQTAVASPAAAVSPAVPPTAAPAAAASGAPDPALVAAGGKLFGRDCAECHAFSPDYAGAGPSLHAVVGATSGTKPDFPYSDALIAAKITWDAKTLDTWLTKPSKMVPGTMMAYIGMANPDDRKALIAFIEARNTAE
jgi:cytochrome c